MAKAWFSQFNQPSSLVQVFKTGGGSNYWLRYCMSNPACYVGPNSSSQAKQSTNKLFPNCLGFALALAVLFPSPFVVTSFSFVMHLCCLLNHVHFWVKSQGRNCGARSEKSDHFKMDWGVYMQESFVFQSYCLSLSVQLWEIWFSLISVGLSC